MGNKIDNSEWVRRRVVGARTVVIENIYHHTGTSGGATLHSSRYSVPLSTDEQPFQRRFSAPPEWTPLETGWIEECSMLVMSCCSDDPNDAILLTKIEILDAAPRPVGIVIRIGRGESARFTLESLTGLSVRGIGPSAVRGLAIRAKVTLFPK